MPKLLFISEACLLDHSSGAALSVRAMLSTLAEAGWEVRACTARCCDGDLEYPLGDIHADLDPARQGGKTVSVTDGPVVHEILVTQSTLGRNLRPWEAQAFHEQVENRLQRFRPDLVLCYGSSLLPPLLASAQRQGARTVFYLANAEVLHGRNGPLPGVDHLITPSAALAQRAQDVLGMTAQVLPNIVAQPFDGAQNRLPARIAGRRQRPVTLINPAPQKGGLFFINLATQASVVAPGVKFRAVESRWRREQWARLGVSEAELDRIDWHPHTRDMSQIYAEASLLLMPSLGFEAAGRVVPEALLSGVPVLAMRNGGIPEQLGEGGMLFDLPTGLSVNPLQAPDKQDLLRWVQFIKVLLENDALYGRAVDLALREAERHQPRHSQAQTVAAFESVLSQPAAVLVGQAPATIDALVRLHEQMGAERAAINARIEAGEDEDGGAPQDTPYHSLLRGSLAQPAIKQALAAANAKDWTLARAILEPYLRFVPEDLTALGLLAEVADAQGRSGEARQLLLRLVELAPGLLQGQQRLIAHLARTGEAASALEYSASLLARAPENPRYQALHAGLLAIGGRFQEAVALYERCLGADAGTADDWMRYARALKTLGCRQAAVDAYRRAIEIAPDNGAAWHGLSDMKLAVFEPDDIDYMAYLLTDAALPEQDRANLHFTLGKAHEDAGHYRDSFQQYAQANAIRRRRSDYDVSRIEDDVAEAKETFTRAFFEARAGYGHPSPAPIFVLGLHRAGSTLVEQILASHSQIEGTRELPQMMQIGRFFHGSGRAGRAAGLNGELLQDLAPDECRRFGQRYLERSRTERVTARPYFVDKMPFNWMHVGLIHLLLPNARIIDIRREPMAAGFALFKMNFGDGVDHAFDQRDIARYYCAYSELMAHFDAVLPGRVHHLRYESLVADTDAEIARLLAYCGVPLEASCLRYWETERAIQTPSSEQVRQPIFTRAVDQWTHYAEWLEPMREVFDASLAPAAQASGGVRTAAAEQGAKDGASRIA